MKKIFMVLLMTVFAAGCVTANVNPTKSKLQTHEIVVRVEAVDPTKVSVTDDTHDNADSSYSSLTTVMDDTAYTTIWAGISTIDVVNLYKDINLMKKYGIKTMRLFVSSGGGGAFAGLALADQIMRAKSLEINVIAYASGIVASAAVPIFVVADERVASSGTIFMVHQASLWKWPGMETHSSIIAQGRMLAKLQKRYLTYMVDNSNITYDEWKEMETRTTWFDSAEAMEFGIVDRIE